MTENWKFEHSVDCQVSRDFAWQFWTQVDNWPVVDSSVERVTLNGPFAAGARGTTKPRDLTPVDWLLTEVEDRSTAVIEILAPGAVFKCQWRFEDSPSGGTRITQEVSFLGAKAGDYVATVGPALEKGIPRGMQKLAEEMVRAAA